MKLYLKQMDGFHYLMQENDEELFSMGRWETLGAALAAKQQVECELYDRNKIVNKIVITWY